MASGFNFSGISAYVDQSDLNLLFADVTAPTFAKYATVQTGIKSKKALHKLAVDPVWQDGDSEDVEGGSDTPVDFSARILETYSIAVREYFSPKKLEAYFTQAALPAGSTYDSLPFGKVITDAFSKTINKKLDIAYVIGERQVSPANSNQYFDGLYKVTEDVTPITGTTITSANIRTTVDAVYAAASNDVKGKDDIIIGMSRTNFTLLTIALANANLFSYKTQGDADANWELKLPQYGGATVVGLEGFDDDTVMLWEKDNVIIGVDVVADSENYRVAWVESMEKIKYFVRWRTGLQTVHPERIVKYQVAA